MEMTEKNAEQVVAIPDEQEDLMSEVFRVAKLLEDAAVMSEATPVVVALAAQILGCSALRGYEARELYKKVFPKLKDLVTNLGFDIELEEHIFGSEG